MIQSKQQFPPYMLHTEVARKGKQLPKPTTPHTRETTYAKLDISLAEVTDNGDPDSKECSDSVCWRSIIQGMLGLIPDLATVESLQAIVTTTVQGLSKYLHIIAKSAFTPLITYEHCRGSPSKCVDIRWVYSSCTTVSYAWAKKMRLSVSARFLMLYVLPRNQYLAKSHM